MYPRHIFWIVITASKMRLNYLIYFLTRNPLKVFWIRIAASFLLTKLFSGESAYVLAFSLLFPFFLDGSKLNLWRWLFSFSHWYLVDRIVFSGLSGLSCEKHEFNLCFETKFLEVLWLTTIFLSFDLLFFVFYFYFEFFFLFDFFSFFLPLSIASNYFAMLSVLSNTLPYFLTLIGFFPEFFTFFVFCKSILSVFVYFLSYFLFKFRTLLVFLTLSVRLFSDLLGATYLVLVEILFDKYYIMSYIHFFSTQGHCDSLWYPLKD